MIGRLALSFLFAIGLASCAIDHRKPDTSEERLDVGPEAPIPSSIR